MIRRLVNKVYGTRRVSHNYELSNPTEKVLISDASKGIKTTNDKNVTRGTDWLTSQRAVLLLTNTHVVFNTWVISIEAIQSCQLLRINSILGDGMVLKIHTFDNENYQFGMSLNPEWTKQNILPLTLEKVKMKYSLFSVVVRLFVIGYLIYWVYNKFQGS